MRLLVTMKLKPPKRSLQPAPPQPKQLSFGELVLQPLQGLSTNILRQTTSQILKPQDEEESVTALAASMPIQRRQPKPTRPAPADFVSPPPQKVVDLSLQETSLYHAQQENFPLPGRMPLDGPEATPALTHGLAQPRQEPIAPPAPTPLVRLRGPPPFESEGTEATSHNPVVHEECAATEEDIQNPTLDEAFAGGRIHVVARCRPRIEEDLVADFEEYRQCVYPKRDVGKITMKREFCQDRIFKVDNVLDEYATQAEAFHVIAEDIVKTVETGVNGTIMCYGQTGGGKTYTAFGREDDESKAGIIPRCVKHLFRYTNAINAACIPGQQARIRVSLLQIYMENITDLLSDTRSPMMQKSMQIREDSSGNVFVQNLKCVEAASPEMVMSIVKNAIDGRVSGETKQNAASSRSHAVLQLHLEQLKPVKKELENGECLMDGEQVIQSRFSTLTIVDLAGSERVTKSGSSGQRLQEAQKINKSIAALGNCISALAEAHGRGNKRHIPFRNSQLTRLLTDSLGGNTRTCLCVNVGPAAINYEETYASMLLAKRAMQIKNIAVVNEVHGIARTAPEPVENEEEEAMELQILNVSEDEDIEMTRRTLLRAMSTPLGAARHEGIGLLGCYQGSSHQEETTLQRENEELKKTILEMEKQLKSRQCLTQPPDRDANIECTEWEAREHALVTKFTGIIHNLQMEIAKQNVAMARLRKEQQNSGRQ